MGLPGSLIDTSFDTNSDAGGRDPDSHSKTLRRYHQLLWSKPLPSGKLFTLDAQLHHKSDLGEFWLSSDGIIHTYSRWTRPRRMVEVVAQVPPGEVAAFYELACTIGGYLPFPRTVRTGGVRHQSINQCRGTHRLIRDRFDLTLECIRRHYVGAESPLTSCLKWRSDFLGLFGDFAGYVDFFLLNDLVSDRVQVQFMTAFKDFEGDPLPDKDVVRVLGVHEAIDGPRAGAEWAHRRLRSFIPLTALGVRRSGSWPSRDRCSRRLGCSQ